MIVARTQNLIVVDKPAAWLTTPARAHDDARTCLGRELTALLDQRIYPVHRLDFGVSGLVVFALDADAHRTAQGWFERGEVVKTYEAESAGEPGLARASESDPENWVEWRSVLVRGKRRAFEATHGKVARTFARRRHDGRYELRPATGRPHQLRFEMAKHGVPIDGDLLYGGVDSVDGTIRLRATRLDFGAVADRLGLPAAVRVKGLDRARLDLARERP